jgi:hypothetical protein
MIDRKTIEGRLNQGDWAEMREGDKIDFYNEDFGLKRHYTSFGEEFFLLKLLHQYFPDIKWDYEQIYIFETRNDIDTECSEQGGRFHELVTRLCKGDKTAFDGKEIEFFPNSFERNKMNISQEIFSCIQHNLDNDGVNWKDYEPRSS